VILIQGDVQLESGIWFADASAVRSVGCELNSTVHFALRDSRRVEWLGITLQQVIDFGDRRE
jgi:hypothetical protein